MDISGSMLAQDLKPDRLEASKNVALDFIRKRRNDRVGLVIFSGESFTQCPLTTDHQVLINLFKDVKSGMVDDGTAIGMGLATSVNRLKDSEAISKVIILLTDGVNNSGMVPPLTAAEIAGSADPQSGVPQALGCKVKRARSVEQRPSEARCSHLFFLFTKRVF